MHILTYPEAEVPRDLRAQVIAIQDQAWPRDGPSGLGPWHDASQNPISLLLVDDGRVLSCLDILSKEITHRGVSYRASGISAMVTDARERQRGLGSEIAAAARDLMETNGADLGIFTCDSYLRAFYEAAGWKHLPGTVLIGGTRDDPFPSDRFDKVTMARFFTPRAKAAEAGFTGERIELYSGTMDKLW